MTLFTIMAELALDVAKFNAAAKQATQTGQALGEDVASGAGKASDALEQTGKAADKASTQVLNMSTGSIKALDKLEKAISATEDSLGDLPENFDGVVDSALNNLSAIRENGGLTLDEMRESISGIQDALDAVDPGTKLDNPKVEKAVEALEKYQKELEKIVDTADEAAGNVEDMGDAAQKAERAAKSGGSNSLFSTITKSLLTKEAISQAAEAVYNFGKESVEAAIEVSSMGPAVSSSFDELDQNINQLKASLGETLLPTILSVTEALNSLFPKKSVTDQYQDFVNGVQKSLSKNLLTLTTGKQSVDGYISRLSELEKKSQWTAQDSLEWKANLDALLEIAPELGSIIDSQTGKIDGGTEALKKNSEEWYKNAEAQAKAAAAAQIMSDAADKQADAAIAFSNYDAAWKEWQARKDEVVSLYPMLAGLKDEEWIGFASAAVSGKGMANAVKEVIALNSAAAALHDTWKDTQAVADEAVSKGKTASDFIMNADWGLQEFNGTAEDTGEIIGTAVNPALQALYDQLQKQEDAYRDAHKAAEDYANSIKDNVVSALDSAYDGYSKVTRIRPMNARTQNRNAETQLKQLQDYAEGLEKLREMGIDENLIAELSDGSTDSMSRVAGLAKSKQSDIDAYVATLKELEELKNSVGQSMADNILTVDPEYQTMLSEETLALQDLYDACKDVNDFTGGPTITIDDLASDVLDGIIGKINALSGRQVSIGMGYTSGSESLRDGTGRIASSRAVGIDYVPYDGFLASLHEGESILTKAENRQRNSRASTYGNQPINLTVNVNGNSKPYEVGQEVRNALENMRWLG